MILASPTLNNQPIAGGCTLWVSVSSSPIGGMTDAAGRFSVPLPIPNNASFKGASVFFQGGVADPNAAIGVAVTGGLQAVLGN